MKMTEARITLDAGNEAVYVDEDADMPRLPSWPYVAIGVEDYEEAKEIFATIDRSRAQKRRAPKLSAPADDATHPPASDGDGARAEDPKPGELPPRCEAPDCPSEATQESSDGNFCAMHDVAEKPILREWHAAFLKAQKVTPAPESAKRARGIRKQVEGAS